MTRHIRNTFMLCLVLSFTASILAQNSSEKLNGHVYNAASGKPIEGASVLSSDTLSTFTNNLGEFSLDIKNKQAQISITADGFARQIIPLKGKKELNIYLYEQGYKSFHSDVNIDYATKPIAYATQSLETSSYDETNYKIAAASAEYLFKNSFAGLNVQARSGLVANGSVLSVNGMNSLNASSRPLIIIDGMIADFNSPGKELISGAAFNALAGININDIESVTLMKDGSAIYGAQGGNGVLFINTIQAKEATTKIDFSSYRGISYAPEKTPVMEAYDYRSYLSEILFSQGISSDSVGALPFMMDNPDENLDYYTYHNETDWQDQIYQNGINQNYNLKISGGDNIALYGLSVGYLQNTGIVKKTNFERYSIRFNSKIKVSQKVNVLANISWSSGLRNLMDDGAAPVTNPRYLSMVKAPFLYMNRINYLGEISPRYEDADILGVSNPLALLDYMMAVQRSNSTLAGLKINYTPTDKITISNRIGISYFKTRFNTFIPHTGVADYVSDLGVIENTMQNKVESKFSIYNDTRATYNVFTQTNQSLNLFAGLRITMNQSEEDWGIAHNSPNDEMRSIGQGVNLYNEIGGYIGDWNYLTYYAQVNYEIAKKYFATLGLSFDGSSRWGDEAKGLSISGNTYAFFPSLTTAWLISSEEFMQNFETVSFAKLRLGLTKAGNGDIGNYAAQRFYVSQNLMGAYGLLSGSLYNPQLQWENNDKYNLGLDIGLWNDRISVGSDFYVNNTSNLLTLIEPEYYVGYDSYLSNIGSLQTTGMDLSVNARIINKSLKWDAGIKLRKNKTIVKEYFGGEEIIDVYGGQILIRENEPLGQFYGYKTNGVFANDADATAANLSAEMPNSDLIPFQAGDVIFEEVEQNNIINENDRQILGNPNPDFSGNFFSSISYAGFTLDAVVSFSYGNEIYNYLRRELESMSSYNNQTLAVLNRWQVQGQNTNMPRAQYGDPMGNARFSDRWIENGSYIRLQDITLNYRLPLSNLINQTIDIFISGQNLITLSNYLGADPEFALGNSPLVRGVDVGLTPQTLTVIGGFKIGL